MKNDLVEMCRVLHMKRNALEGMGHLAIAKGVEVAITEVQVYAIMNLGYTIDDFSLRKEPHG